MIPSRPLTKKEEREVHHYYHMVLDIAVKLELCPNTAQREHLVQLLLQAADDAEPASLFIRAAINYVRASE